MIRALPLALAVLLAVFAVTIDAIRGPGETRPAHAAAADSDGDGVCDRGATGDGCTGSDLCSRTPAGAEVDANGCSSDQVDSDGDGFCNRGVTSSLCSGSDRCSRTGAGLPVDENGCAQAQVDSNLDGACNRGATSGRWCPNDPQQISVSGNGVTIVNGDHTPSLDDHTDFGDPVVGEPTTRTFTIHNTGTASLALINITVSGGFAIVAPLAADTVDPGASTSLNVECPGTEAGTITGEVTIESNDSDNHPYTFALRCEVTAPEIHITGNGVTIVAGDTTPSLDDHTDFGETVAGTPVSRTFIIHNTGTADLGVFGWTLTEPFSMSLDDGPTGLIPPGGSKTFTVECSPDVTNPGGEHFGYVEIASTDGDEGDYRFYLRCLVKALAPEIHITGNGVTIVAGDTTPSLDDHTDFGETVAGTPVSRTFTIHNTGTADLGVFGWTLTEPFSMSLDDGPTGLIPPGGSKTFTVECSPDATDPGGEHLGYVEIASTDSDEGDYRFYLRCLVKALAPEIHITGNGVTIVAGDTTPSLDDHTDFGETVAGIPVSRTFIIHNTGTADLGVFGWTLTEPFSMSLDDGPTGLIPPGGSKTFTVECSPDVTNPGGEHFGYVEIASTDSDEGDYRFYLRCEVLPAVPDIEVRGNGLAIPDGDTTPGTDDHTDFGATVFGTPVERTFSVHNTGTATLTLHPFSFGISGQFGFVNFPDTELGPGESTDLIVRCSANQVTVSLGTVTLRSNDPDEDPYTFTVRCEVLPAVPDIEVRGNGLAIPDGDTTPSADDHTDFGATLFGTPVERTFAVHNTGTATLTLDPFSFGISGQFGFVNFPDTELGPGESTDLIVRCSANQVTVSLGTVTLRSDDPDEDPYTFTVRCEVLPAPEIHITGNGITIVAGDTTPSLDDGTDFGVTVLGAPITHTFTIHNTGTADLTVSSWEADLPVTIPTENDPGGTIPPGGSKTFGVFCPANAVTVTEADKAGHVQINTNDADEGNYRFDVRCVVNPPGPEINVTGNGVTIVAGDTTPSTLDGTDFGQTESGTPLSMTFTIQNTGSAVLNLSATELTGGFPADPTSLPTSTISPGGSTSLTLSCPGAVGVHLGTVTFRTDDADEPAYTFSIRCEVTESPID